MVQTADFELYYFGLYSYDPPKIAWYPRDFYIDDSSTPTNIVNCGTNIYMVSTEGFIYNWDLKMSSKFKMDRYKDNTNNFADISTGKGFLVMRKAYVCPKNC